MRESIDDIAKKDGRFSPAVVKFVYEALGHTTKNLVNEPGHVSGQTLCEGIKDLALQKWGRLANLVLNVGGVHTTHDLGEIVYLMIDHKWMSAQPEDSIEDFDDIFDFRTELRDRYCF